MAIERFSSTMTPPTLIMGCCDCGFRDQCPVKQQLKDCVVRTTIKAIKTRREREKIAANKVANTSMRAGIEGNNSALKRTVLDKLDIRGSVKCEIVCGLKVTVQNIKRFIKFKQGGYKEKPGKIPLEGFPAPVCA